MAASPIDAYRRQIERELQAGNATEHTHRPALKTLIESLASGVTATNEPKRVECGAPDFAVTEKRAHGPVTIGHLEAKDVGKDLDEIEKSEQMKRYLPALANLILTDYLEFRWYVNGEHRQSARLARVGKAGKLAPEKGAAEAVTDLLSVFLSRKAEPINDPKTLALRMARLTHFIRDMIVTAFDAKAASATLRDLHGAFEKALIPDLPIPQFADMFAQTLAYGLFAARVNHHGPTGSFKRPGAASQIPKTNPFLRKLFETITGTELDEEPYAGFVDDLAQLLADTDIEAVLADFGKRTARQDPVVHFYETFLAAYDPKLREARGVYYTPEPVVSYLVRSVDYLLKTRFGCANGLADTATVDYEREDDSVAAVYDRRASSEKTGAHRAPLQKATSPRVLILDPACGTGTFLYAVIDHIRAEFMRQENAGMWSGYVRNHLLPRIFGFELLMAPYAVAHFKLGMQLAGHDLTPAQREKWAYDFSGDERLRVYLTNTLEEAERKAETLFGPLRVISQEANAALKIKSELPILAVIGNPPYSGHSANRSWETKEGKRVPTFIGHLIQDYYSVDGKPLGEKNPKWLQDDYVKFIRWGQWRIERTGAGILAFITNHGYLDNPTFRGMRRSLMNAFTEIHVLDLHGNSKKKERAPDGSQDENVFDIQQGVALGIFLKEPSKAGPAKVYHGDLWGLREGKYSFLFDRDAHSTACGELSPLSPLYLFVPKEEKVRAEYEQAWKVTNAVPVYGVGMTTARDHIVTDFDMKPLLERAATFRDSGDSDAEVCNRLGIPQKKGWNVKRARELIREERNLGEHVRPILYRPFDERVIFYHESLVWRTVRQIMSHMLRGKNVGLCTTRSVEIGGGFEHVFCSQYMIQHHSVSLKEVNYLFPTYLYPLDQKQKHAQARLDVELSHWPPGKDGRRPNFNAEFVADLERRLGLSFVPDGKGDLKKTFGPEDVFHYAYAVFHSPTYRSRYAESLKTDFARLPLTGDKKLFARLSKLGAELTAMHLLEKVPASSVRYPRQGDSVVQRVDYKPPTSESPGRVSINDRQYFDKVPPEVFAFHVGGYQVCEKWLKDRKGRSLSYDDIEHYRKMTEAVRQTLRVMEEIDQAIPGWPLT